MKIILAIMNNSESGKNDDHFQSLVVRSKEFVWVKGLRNIPSTVMWPAMVVEQSGDQAVVYIQSDHAELSVKMKDTCQFDTSQVASLQKKFIGILRKKRLLSTLKEFEADVEWLQFEMTNDQNSETDEEEVVGENDSEKTSDQNSEMTNDQNSVTVEEEVIAQSDSEKTNDQNSEMTNDQNSETVEEEVIAESDSEKTNDQNSEMTNDQNSETVEEEVIAESDSEKTNDQNSEMTNDQNSEPVEEEVIAESDCEMTNDQNSEMTNDQNSETVEEEVIAESDCEMTNDQNSEMTNDQNSETVEEEVIAESDCEMTNDQNSEMTNDQNSETVEEEVIAESDSEVRNDQNSEMTNYQNSEMTNDQNSVTVEEEVIAEGDSEMTNYQNSEMTNDQNSVTVEEEDFAESDSEMTNDQNNKTIKLKVIRVSEESVESDFEMTNEPNNKTIELKVIRVGDKCQNNDNDLQLDIDVESDHSDDMDPDYVPDSEEEEESVGDFPDFLNAIMTQTDCTSVTDCQEKRFTGMFKESEVVESQHVGCSVDVQKPYQRKVKEDEIVRDNKFKNIYIKKYLRSNDGKCGPKKHDRPYDTVHACKYCSKLFSHIQDHLEKKHHDRGDVKRIMNLQQEIKKGGNKGLLKDEIKKLQDCLRFMGDHLHNQLVKECKEGELLIQRKSCSKEEFKFDEYGPCSECLQWIKLESSVFNHQKNCPKKMNGMNSKTGKNILIWQAKIVCGEVQPSGSEMLKKEVFAKMRKDDLSDCAQGDYLIRNLGEVWLTKSIDHKLRRGRISSFQMRLAARLLLECRKRLKNPSLNMHDLLIVTNFDLVVEVTLDLCGKNEDEELKSPSVATKLGFDIGRLLGLKCGYCLRGGDVAGKKEAKAFLEVMRYEWSTKVSKRVSSLVKQRHFDNRRQLPHPKDIETIATTLATSLQNYDFTEKTQYVAVAKMALLRLMVYNRRRSGEMEELMVDTFLKRRRGIDDVEQALLGDLSSTEKYLMKSQELMWIRGKQGKRVPVLIPPDATKALEYLVDPEVRRLAGIKQSNRYMFATTGDGVLYAAQCIKELSFENGNELIHPDRLTSTGYRAYMATIAQCIGLKDHQVQWLCTHLGHTEEIHKTHYRFTLDGIERIQLGKLMLLQDKNLLGKYKGQNLEEIEFQDIVSSIDTEGDSGKRVETDIEAMDTAESFPEMNASHTRTSVNAYDLTGDVPMDSMVTGGKNKPRTQVKRTRWTEKEVEEIHLYAEKWLRRQKTPSRQECLKMINLSKKNGGELYRRTPDLIVKKISAINMKSRKPDESN